MALDVRSKLYLACFLLNQAFIYSGKHVHTSYLVRYYAIESVAFWNIVSIQFIQSFTKVYHLSAGTALDNTSLQGETDNFPSCVSKCYYCWCCSHRDRSVFPFFRVENTNNTGQNVSYTLFYSIIILYKF